MSPIWVMVNNSTPMVNKDMVKKVNIDEEMITCNECIYECLKLKPLKNHMITKHEYHKYFFYFIFFFCLIFPFWGRWR